MRINTPSLSLDIYMYFTSSDLFTHMIAHFEISTSDADKKSNFDEVAGWNLGQDTTHLSDRIFLLFIRGSQQFLGYYLKLNQMTFFLLVSKLLFTVFSSHWRP